MATPNHLINETSPYLLQHAYNPVNWYPWGDEALGRSRTEDKPILVSIGYSACHWCHVMERESFEDEATAEIMNDKFINIKIDREERPDLDHIYMDAVQAISGSGGWPLNVFLTPEGKPFYGGTYFPPVRAFNRSSWKEVLLSIHQVFTTKRQEVNKKAEELTTFISNQGSVGNLDPVLHTPENIFKKEQVESIYQNLMKQADTVWGGFGKAPKFPQTFSINFLLRYYHYTGNHKALKQALLSIDKMLFGGIYDQIAGGFARYSTDEQWLAPHFEKMLYDNALLLSTLSEAYMITKDEKYKNAIQQTINFINRELTDKNGGFYAALDADSEGEEGKFYVWSKEEIDNILGVDAALFCSYYDVSQNGNWEHKNILRVLQPFEDFVKQNNLKADDFFALLKRSSEKLLKIREQRIRPGTDDKIINGWNGLMIIALCQSAAALSDKSYLQQAINTFDFVIERFSNFQNSTNFFHTYKNGIAKYPAFLDDYAYLICAAIHLQEHTSENKYLEFARSVTEYVIQNFSDEENMHFYYTAVDQKDIIARKKEIYDGAVPAGNSVMAYNLLYLSVIFDLPQWKQRTFDQLTQLSDFFTKYPGSFGNWACIFIEYIYSIKEIVVLGKDFENQRNELLSYFLPGKVLQSKEVSDDQYPLLRKGSINEECVFFLCKEYTCGRPVNSLESFMKEMLTV
ncbi:thioredoxin domain-containing protein [soil metagenome]